MIDLNKIEAAAKSAPPSNWKVEEYGLFAATANPATVLEMVSMIRERDAVLRQALECLCRAEEMYDAKGRSIDQIEAAGDADPVIAAIKEVLNEPTQP